MPPCRWSSTPRARRPLRWATTMAVAAELLVRVAGADDAGARASLRASWTAGAEPEPQLESRIAAWLAEEGSRRTTWLAALGGSPAGMASLFEYRRMPRPDR